MTSLFSRCIWTRSDTQNTCHVQSQHRSNISKRYFYETSSEIDCKMIKKCKVLYVQRWKVSQLSASPRSQRSRWERRHRKPYPSAGTRLGSIALKSRLKSLKNSTWIAFLLSLYWHRILPNKCADLSLPGMRKSAVKGFFFFVAVAEEFLVLIFLLLGVWYDSKLTSSLFFLLFLFLPSSACYFPRYFS